MVKRSTHVTSNAAISGWPLYRDLFVRFSDQPECHRTFFIADPSNNLIEFKHYDEDRFVY